MALERAVPAFLISARYVVDPADTAAYKALAGRMAEAAHRRAGCSFLNAAQDVLDPNIFHLTEGWISEEAFHEHLASDTFQAVLREALELRIIERSGKMYFVAGEQTLDMPS
ncbi:antibiotic biosynthesis monooxygenase [Sphingomonas sp. AR_OL41]|uniref:putative quinol monooxygenase n=1 Tax=Sphingomonas sp. AR_OL41 TaxID=3042729 RepID=UPI0024805527|nr:antibiotic biosynthesis monooxygenase [Sphingomonas sp. AR_OL41]MDH7972851.1 antibiotic biosynthesis monooxygenase [Sphingomonas sp. AR_OL41]